MEKLIIDKACELFSNYGLKSVTMEDLAKHAGISKKTIYHFFADKKELVARVVNELIKYHHQLLIDNQKESGDAIEEVLLHSQAPFQTWSTIHPGFFHELEKHFPEAHQILMLHEKKILFPAIASNLKRGKEDGIYRTDIQDEFIAEIRIQQLYTALQPGKFTSRKTDSGMLIFELTIFYLHALTTEKGKNILNTYIKNKDE